MPNCTYATPGARRRNNNNADNAAATPDEMQGRIDRLESLVLSLMTNGGQASGAAAAAAALSASRSDSADLAEDMDEDLDETERAIKNTLRDDDSEVERVSKSMGVMKVQGDRQIFASEGHWYAILSDISEVKNWFARSKEQYEDQIKKIQERKSKERFVGTSMLFKGTQNTSHDELLSRFPRRHIANMLITRYFESENPATHIIHRPTFRKQYERHWATPQASSVPWLGMCYAMMCLALQSYHRAQDAPPDFAGHAWEESLAFLSLTTECLVQADFTQPMFFMIETLCLYLQAEHARSRDSETGVWVLVGIVARLAMRVGLHRDPRPYPALTPFYGEMRRRLWNFIRSADINMSHQVGMPSLIKSVDCDTALPTNIHDEEFDEDTKVLPPSRPMSETTPMSFMIVNCHMSFILGKILEESNALTTMPYETVQKLDSDLREVRSHIPAHLVMRTRDESTLDPSPIIMQRYALELLYLKSQISLHRKFTSKARENPRFSYSRRTCVESCLGMINHQAAIHAESMPGGRLHHIPWTITSAVTMADFSLAGMILCLDLYHTASSEKKNQTSGDEYAWGVSKREEMFSAIELSLRIWDQLKDHSMEAFKSSGILRIMLEKLRNHTDLVQQMSKNFSFVPGPPGVAPDQVVAPPEHSAAMTLGMMSSGMTPDSIGMMGGGFPAPKWAGLTPSEQQAQIAASAQAVQQAAANGGPMDAATPNFPGFFGPPGIGGSDLVNMNWDWVSCLCCR